jgi:biotin carboxylase
MCPRTVENCRDKASTRRVLTEAGIPQPRSVAVAALEQARAEAAHTGFPVVFKPRGLGASQGVVLVRDSGEVEAAYEVASSASYPGVPSFENGVLVEEYMDGPEISVDGAVVDGRYAPMFLAHKELGPPPYFEETGHIVDPQDPLLADRDVIGMLAAAHTALGVERGMTHSELRLTDKGPRLIEINARLGGDLIPYLGMLATGVDPGRVAARVALGQEALLSPTRNDTVGIRFLSPDGDSRLRAITLPAACEVEGLLSAQTVADPGTVLRLPPRGYVARHSYVICRGNGLEECRERLARAAALVRIDCEPAPEYDGDSPDLSWLPAAAQTACQARPGDPA